MKNWVKGFGFFDNFIWIGCAKFSIEWREYLSSAVNVLSDSPEISDLSQRDIFLLNWSQNDEKTDNSVFVQISAVIETW